MQPESVPVTLMLCASLTVGDTGGDNVSFPVKVVQVNALVDVEDDDVDVVDPAGAELLDEDPHADRNTMTAINVPVVTTRCLRIRVTSVLVKMGAPYIATSGRRPDGRNTVPRG
ncbi:MAG: hypothetical protein QOH28_3785 [Actinomycetota bacterium]|nr:hypothetical protein [Actinomycetota bacterium]